MGNALWVWKSFLRGHNPILMGFGIIDVADPFDLSLGIPSYESFEPARFAMGDTLRFAGRMNLVEMEPRGDLSSTGYALANPTRGEPSPTARMSWNRHSPVQHSMHEIELSRTGENPYFPAVPDGWIRIACGRL